MAKGMGGMMKQAQKLQSKMAKVQQELEGKTVEGDSGGGMVVATANGHQEITGIKINPEVVDPETGAVLPDGEAGELVFTSLTKEALPIIRYRTRDLTRLLPGTARSMRRIEKITGRTDDMIILRGVNLFPTQIEEQILNCAGLAPHFQIELSRAARMDVMTVNVEAAPGHEEKAARDAAAKELAHHIKSVIGISSRVAVGDPGTVERSLGKAKRVDDLRPKG